jgi:exopolysaccharide production protein ExoF
MLVAFCSCRSRWLLAGALIVVLTAAVPAEEYRFGPLDTLKIRIVEWQPEDGSFKDWSAFDGEYLVSPSGELSVPFLGPVRAEGETADALSDAIATGLAKKLGIAGELSASVEIARFSPVFLAGDVQTPGQYPFQTGLTVLKGVALAGGLVRSAEQNQSGAASFIAAKGEYDVLVGQLIRLQATQARLQAELDARGHIPVPDALKQSPDAKPLLAGEQAIMSAHQAQQQTEIEALASLKQLLNSGLASLAKKTGSQEQELELLDQQLKTVDALAQKGLAVNTQIIVLKQQIADLQSRLLDTNMATLSTNKDLNKADLDAASLKAQRDADLLSELQSTRAAIAETTLRLASQRDLMMNAVLQSAASLSSRKGTIADYSIIRLDEGKAEEIAADENTEIKPGDVIKAHLRIELSGDASTSQVPAQIKAP